MSTVKEKFRGSGRRLVSVTGKSPTWIILRPQGRICSLGLQRLGLEAFFLPREATRSAVLPRQVARLSVCLWRWGIVIRMEFCEKNFTIDWLNYNHFAVPDPNISSWKVTITTHRIKSYTGFRLRPKCMTLNDPWVRFKVIPCCKNDEIQLSQLSNNSDAM